MRITVKAVVTCLMLCAIAAFAEKKIYAPLPEKVVAAKAVFFVNESGTARFGDDLYRQIRAWNRWDVVTDRGKADLVLVLSPSDTVPVVITHIRDGHGYDIGTVAIRYEGHRRGKRD